MRFKPYQSYHVHTCTAFHSAEGSVYEQKMLMKRPKRLFLFITNIVLGLKLLSLLLLWTKIMLHY